MQLNIYNYCNLINSLINDLFAKTEEHCVQLNQPFEHNSTLNNQSTYFHMCFSIASTNKPALGDSASRADGSNTPKRLLEGCIDNQTVTQALVV